MNSGNLFCVIRGPLTVIALGALFAMDHFTAYGFHQTWPILLILFGVLTLFCRRRNTPSRAGGPG